ncbi:hypothetical protein [Streptosporangium roseum]|uniref:Lipoprotein n=1 Tax=Streptosporangium roseum (strain ATCC 12428 / DSM 43021 / JCM 3005 / KCTC 9067 / NCIMB 10171 / NRRL 2505 / NI 9100) TaxID=479432 RepID=D2B1X4_STRRD|nr:hypothetical protein [Streptosporangium roseum]ACZ89198.1 hypothetical protein Sros_6484 [Streptosporangium roseum DSM 43021]
MRRSRARFAVVAAGLVPALAGGLTGCAGSEFTYVRHDDGQTYFKVPAAWRQVDQKALDKATTGADPESATARLRRQLVWSIAYDAHASPSAGHLLGYGTGDEPFVFARVTRLLPEERDAVSLNGMRNSVIPVTESLRKEYAQVPGYPLTGFELLADDVLQPGDGLRGVHVRFNYTVQGAGTQTFDLTSYLAGDGERISTLLIRCSAGCYRRRAAEFDRIAHSFKVKRLTG